MDFKTGPQRVLRCNRLLDGFLLPRGMSQAERKALEIRDADRQRTIGICGVGYCRNGHSVVPRNPRYVLQWRVKRQCGHFCELNANYCGQCGTEVDKSLVEELLRDPARRDADEQVANHFASMDWYGVETGVDA